VHYFCSLPKCVVIEPLTNGRSRSWLTGGTEEDER
jgi:hypothetical protein